MQLHDQAEFRHRQEHLRRIAPLRAKKYHFRMTWHEATPLVRLHLECQRVVGNVFRAHEHAIDKAQSDQQD